MALMAGDFNARTGSASGRCLEDFNDVLDASLQPDPRPSHTMNSRISADNQPACAFGKTLLELCETCDLSILNGCAPGDTNGRMTCNTAQGSSVVDYFLTSGSLTKTVLSMAVGDKCAESDHCPLTLELMLQDSEPEDLTADNVDKACPSVKIEKIRYDASKRDIYREKLLNLLAPVFTLRNRHCCLALALQSCIAEAALECFGRPSKRPLQKANQKWYDAECKHARAALKGTAAEIHECAVKSYKQLLRRKRRAWQRKAQQELCELASRNPRSFWRTYRERQSHKSNIPKEQWKASFQSLYKAPEASPAARPEATTSIPNPVIASQSPTPECMACPSHDATEPASDFLNAAITHEDVSAALKRLKRNKAAGVDGIRAEFILDACDVLLDPLVQTFNQVLNEGVPPAWCTGLIHPIFKSGDPDDPGNYRGITVVVILAKLYAMVLEARASAWAENSKCRAKGQAGFRKDFRTTDQVFIMQTLMQQARQSKRKLYTCFVDFKKAFDLVPRCTLWKVLEQRGMKGKVLSSLKAMYSADTACVLTKEGPTALFECGIGVKQGCPASPLLFGLYLDELEEQLEKAAADIDCPRIAEMLLAILLFADDIALFSYSEAGLQKQLDILSAFCAARGLTVNVKKTKSVVFERRKSNTCSFLFNGDVIEQVDEFKYLGMLMHSTKGLGPAIDYLCKAAKRAMFGLQRRCQQLQIHDPVLKCKLFDTLVKPILCYCCEVWSITGSKAALEGMERIQVGFLKILLGVQVHTKTLHVLAEFGRYPLQISWQSQAAKYMQRLESLPVDRILKQAFIADGKLPRKLSWQASLVSQLHDFLVAAPSEENPARHSFSLQSASSAHTALLQSDPSSKTRVYRDLKSGYVCEPYIQGCSNKHLRRIMAQFRTGSHWLNIEIGRHQGLAREDRTCPMCQHRVVNPGLSAAQFDSFDSDEDGPEPIEDEHHVIFDCSGYAYARQLFPDLFNQSISTVGQFLSQPNCNRVAKFLTWVRNMRLNIA